MCRMRKGEKSSYFICLKKFEKSSKKVLTDV